MSTEVTFTDDAIVDMPPPETPVVVKDDAKTAKPKKDVKAKTEEDENGKAPRSPALTALRQAEDLSIKEMVESFGADGAFSIRITRKWPEFAIDATGKRVQVSGFLSKIDKIIDEDWLQSHYGGGTYELCVRKRDEKGKYATAANKTVMIAGEPNLTELPRSSPASSSGPTVVSTAQEAPSIVNKTLDFMERQIEKAEQRGGGRTGDDPMIEIMREQLRESREAQNNLMARLERLQDQINKPPAQTHEEKTKDRFLEKLIDEDSARIQTVRAQYDSEIRQLKEHALANENRLHDRFERDRSDARAAHERELALLRTSHESTVASIKASTDTQISSAKASFETSLSARSTAFDTQKEIMQAEIRRLERELAEMRDDLKELRGKKEKTIVEQVKDLEIIKDALGVGDGDDKGTAEKIIEAITNPDAIAAVGKMMGKEPAAPAAPVEPPRPPRPRVVRDKESGQKFIVSPDGKHMRPAKPPPIPGEPQIPDFPPEVVNQVVGYLERAYTAGTEPSIVAQSARAAVPEPILMAIRDVGGVDAFLTKVAKLPSSSPLSQTQAGRNWVKKVGKALVGE